MIPETRGYGWTSTGEQPSVMSDGGQAEGEALESLDGRRREQRDPSRLSPGTPGETSRELVLRQQIPDSAFSAVAEKRRLAHHILAFNIAQHRIDHAEHNSRARGRGQRTRGFRTSDARDACNSFKEFAEGGSSVATSNSAITAPRLLSSSRGAASGRRRDPAAVPRIRRRRNVRLQSRPSADVLCPSYCESRR